MIHERDAELPAPDAGGRRIGRRDLPLRSVPARASDGVYLAPQDVADLTIRARRRIMEPFPVEVVRGWTAVCATEGGAAGQQHDAGGSEDAAESTQFRAPDAHRAALRAFRQHVDGHVRPAHRAKQVVVMRMVTDVECLDGDVRLGPMALCVVMSGR